MDHPFIYLSQTSGKRSAGGLLSVCSAHPLVIRAAMSAALRSRQTLAVEATAKQVNQYGGYAGLTPAGFAALIDESCAQTGLPRDRIILGLDHLGPHVWPQDSVTVAMEKAGQLVRLGVRAGFRKIHLDTVTGHPVDQTNHAQTQRVARRAVQLCRIAEETTVENPACQPVCYVIGTDVPLPGGGLAAAAAPVTAPLDLEKTIAVFEASFLAAGLEQAWQRVAAVVVQPGIDFGDYAAAPYDRARAAALAAWHQRLPPGMTYEIHSADYQSSTALVQLVEDRFNLLKIGPCLTFALREALFALADLEQALPGVAEPSDLRRTIEVVMIRHSAHWRSHYQGTPADQRFLRSYSLRDRIRYYWNCPPIRTAVNRLLINLKRPVPPALIGQFLPDVPVPWHCPHEALNPEAVIAFRIERILRPYLEACRADTAAD